MNLPLKKRLVIAAMVPVIGVPLASATLAQTTDTQPGKTGQSQGQQAAQRQSGGQGQQGQQATKIRDMRAGDIIGAKVQNAKGNDLGEVQDLVVNTDQGRVEYAIVAFGGTLGFGEKLFAYPMDRFRASSSGSELVLNATEQEMKNAPGFDRSSWPNWGGGYRGEVDKHFGKTAKAGGNLLRMSNMLNNKVVDRIGNGVGEVEDVVVSVTDGKVRYVALKPDSELNMENRLLMLPMNAMRATGQQQFQNKLQAQLGQPGQGGQQAQSSGGQPQPQSGGQQQQAQQSQQGQPQQQAQSGGGQSQSQSGGQQQQAQQKEQDLLLVLNIEPGQLKKARTIQAGQWPELNQPAFQREMDNYVASFPSGGKGSEASGGSGGQGQTGSAAAGAGAQQEQRPKAPPTQEGAQQSQPGTTNK